MNRNMTRYRGPLVVAVLSLLILSAAAGAYAASIQDAPKLPDVDVDITHDSGPNWTVSPVWLAIGGVAVVVVLALIMAASRGSGGTTVVKD